MFIVEYPQRFIYIRQTQTLCRNAAEGCGSEREMC